MIIKIKDKELELNFGVRFLREIDKITEQTITANGYQQKFSEGINVFIPKLLLKDSVTVATLLQCALWKEKGKFSINDIDDYIDTLTLDEYDRLVEDILLELEAANGTKKVVTMVKEQLKNEMNMQV